MPNVIALTQFVFIALGSVGVIVMSRTQGMGVNTLNSLRLFMASNAIWMLLLPLGWWVFAQVFLNFRKGAFATQFVQVTGVLFAAAILGFYAWLIL